MTHVLQSKRLPPDYRPPTTSIDGVMQFVAQRHHEVDTKCARRQRELDAVHVATSSSVDTRPPRVFRSQVGRTEGAHLLVPGSDNAERVAIATRTFGMRLPAPQGGEWTGGSGAQQLGGDFALPQGSDYDWKMGKGAKMLLPNAEAAERHELDQRFLNDRFPEMDGRLLAPGADAAERQLVSQRFFGDRFPEMLGSRVKRHPLTTTSHGGRAPNAASTRWEREERRRRHRRESSGRPTSATGGAGRRGVLARGWSQEDLERMSMQDHDGGLHGIHPDNRSSTGGGNLRTTASNAERGHGYAVSRDVAGIRIWESALEPGPGADMLDRGESANPAGAATYRQAEAMSRFAPPAAEVPPHMPQLPPHAVEIIPLRDEWDPAPGVRAVSDPAVSRTSYGVVLFAEVPGAGKTTAVKLAYPKALFVVPNDALEKDLHGQSLAAMTPDVFFRLTPDQWEGKRMPREVDCGPDLTYYDAVCFEEVGLQTTFTLQLIRRWMREQNPDIPIVATGDNHQLPPQGEEHLMSERTRIIDDIFPKRFVLRENKRCSEDVDRRRIKEICNEIRHAPDPHAVVNDAFEEVTDVRCLSRDGVVAIAYKESTCELVNMIAQGDYCRSCQSLQGMSVAGVLLVLDSPDISRQWLFTAVTRSRNLDFVWILRADKIPGQVEADLLANRRAKPSGQDMVVRKTFQEQWHGQIPPQPRPSGGGDMLRRQTYNFVMTPDLIHMTMRNSGPKDGGYVQLKGVGNG